MLIGVIFGDIHSDSRSAPDPFQYKQLWHRLYEYLLTPAAPRVLRLWIGIYVLQ